MKSRRSRRKRSYRRLIVLTMGLVVLLLTGTAYMFFNREIPPNRPADSELMASDSVLQVMIMGVDQRADDVGRSDTLMVLSADTKNDKAFLLSIPRDTRVYMEGNGYDKINHAYAFGGHELTKKTVESLLDVPMDYYIVVDVHAFEQMIDAIGGVDIDIDQRMKYEDPWDDDGGLVIDLYPGRQHLNGEQAMEYVRYRDEEGDIGRIARQQKFMQALLDQAASPRLLFKLPALLEAVKSAVHTNLSTVDLLRFAAMLKKVREHELTVATLPGKPAFFQDISYWLPDIKAVRTELAGILGAPMDADRTARVDQAVLLYAAEMPKGLEVVDGTVMTKKDARSAEAEKALPPAMISVRVINSSGINGAGAEAAAVLRRKGFVVSAVETGTTSSREQTSIMTAADNVELFYGMPFPCVIMAGGERKQAVLNIGKDYRR